MNKVTRIVVILLSSIAILLVLITVIGFWPGSTKNIESIANRFQPDPSWTLESETINPPRIICLQADCGKVRKVWNLDKPLPSEAAFKKQTTMISENMQLSESCIDKAHEERSTPVCDSQTSIEGYEVRLQYRHFRDSNPILILNVEKEI